MSSSSSPSSPSSPSSWPASDGVLPREEGLGERDDVREAESLRRKRKK